MKKAIVIIVIIMAVAVLAGCEAKPKIEYFQISKEDIAANLNDPQSIIEPLWWSVSIYDGPEKYESDLNEFSLPQRYVFAIQWYIAEVNNGGHEQFFFNSTGIVWKDALQGFKEIGHKRAEQILQSAIDKIGGNPPLSRETRQAILEKCEADFENLDSELCEINDLESEIMQYIKAHAEYFLFSGNVEFPY